MPDYGYYWQYVSLPMQLEFVDWPHFNRACHTFFSETMRGSLELHAAPGSYEF